MEILSELTEKTRSRLDSITVFPGVEISNSLKEELKKLIMELNHKKVSFNRNSFYVETSPRHYAIIPNQYFFLATECYDLVVKLRILFDFF